MSDNIPFEIQEEIMKKLPVESLIQFRSVSKLWKSVIDSSKFIADHQAQQPQRLFISYKRYFSCSGTYDEFISIVDDETFPQRNFTPTLPESACSLVYSLLVGSSHGLFCFYGYDKCVQTMMAYIWNPSIRKSIVIGVPHVYGIGTFYETVVGFGVCPLTLDPKIIVIPQCAANMEGLNSHLEHVKVFTLTSRAWRSPYNNVLRETTRFQESQVVIDRFIYWLAVDMVRFNTGSGCNLIVSFDLTNEEFRETRLPESFKNKSLSISKFREMLVVLEYNMLTSGRQLCAVWMMDNDVPNSFTQLYTISASLNTILGFRKTDAIIIERQGVSKDWYHTSSLAIYERDANHITDMGVSGKRFSFTVHSYMETLLLLDQPDGTIQSDKDQMVLFRVTKIRKGPFE